MAVKLYDSELKVMELLWREGELPAKDIAGHLKEQTEWSKTTTYTVIKKCIEKNAVQRIEPGFICRPLISIEEARNAETSELINKMYGGSKDLLIASLLGHQKMTPDEIDRLKRLVDELSQGGGK